VCVCVCVCVDGRRLEVLNSYLSSQAKKVHIIQTRTVYVPAFIYHRGYSHPTAQTLIRSTTRSLDRAAETSLPYQEQQQPLVEEWHRAEPPSSELRDAA